MKKKSECIICGLKHNPKIHNNFIKDYLYPTDFLKQVLKGRESTDIGIVRFT